jgi:hypothetical protein
VPGTGAPPDPGQEVDAQHFWLSDTQNTVCDRPRQSITTDSTANDTLGSCGAANAPDALYRVPPPREPNHPTLFNYGTDVNPSAQGLALLSQEGTCTSNPGNAQQLQTWLTPVLNLNVGGSLTSPDAALHVWTRLPVQSTAGELCVFMRQSGLGLLVPTGATMTGLANANCNPRPQLLPTHFRCTAPSWPTAWTMITIEMDYLAVGVVSRLELSLAGHHTGNPGNLLQIAYDHASYPSHLDIFPVL